MSVSGSFDQPAPGLPGIAPASPRTMDGKRRREPPFSLRLSDAERARLAGEAGGAPLGSYIKAKLLGGAALPVRVRRSGLPVEDRQALGQALALLGASRMGPNLDQLAHAAKSGSLVVTAETLHKIDQALADIRDIRRLLLSALGLKEGERR